MNEGMRFEGLSLTVEDVPRSLAFYHGQLGLEIVYKSLPAFALLRGGAVTLGLLSAEEAAKEAVAASQAEQQCGVHVEFTTDDLDGLYQKLVAVGVSFIQPPHDEPWERSMAALDPDGHSVEFAEGRRGSRLRTNNA